MSDPTNGDSIIDSRDLIQRFEDLKGEARDNYATAHPEDDDPEVADTREGYEEWLDGDELDEFRVLDDLCSEGEGYSDWSYGETLIREDYFVTYAQELADDIGAIDANARWPLNHIDWEAAADELLSDYGSVDFDGVTYYIRY